METYLNNKNRKRWWIIPLIVVVGLAVIVLGGYLVWNSVRTENAKIQAKEKIERRGGKAARVAADGEPASENQGA